MDKKEIELLVRERDAHIEKLIQAKKDLARRSSRGARTHQQELELRAVQKIVDDEPVQIAMLAFAIFAVAHAASTEDRVIGDPDCTADCSGQATDTDNGIGSSLTVAPNNDDDGNNN